MILFLVQRQYIRSWGWPKRKTSWHSCSIYELSKTFKTKGPGSGWPLLETGSWPLVWPSNAIPVLTFSYQPCAALLAIPQPLIGRNTHSSFPNRLWRHRWKKKQTNDQHLSSFWTFSSFSGPLCLPAHKSSGWRPTVPKKGRAVWWLKRARKWMGSKETPLLLTNIAKPGQFRCSPVSAPYFVVRIWQGLQPPPPKKKTSGFPLCCRLHWYFPFLCLSGSCFLITFLLLPLFSGSWRGAWGIISLRQNLKDTSGLILEKEEGMLCRLDNDTFIIMAVALEHWCRAFPFQSSWHIHYIGDLYKCPVRWLAV